MEIILSESELNDYADDSLTKFIFVLPVWLKDFLDEMSNEANKPKADLVREAIIKAYKLKDVEGKIRKAKSSKKRK